MLVAGFRNPFIKSLLNLNVDYSGKFFLGLKRLRAARKILANVNLLNRVRPRELSDLMIQRRQLPRSKTGRLLILRRAFRLVVGVKHGNSKAFYKRLHTRLVRVTQQRQDRVIREFVCKLDLFLCNLKLFETVSEAQDYIVRFGVFVNDSLVFNSRRLLNSLDIVSFLQEHRYFFKARFYYVFSSSSFFTSRYTKLSRVFANLISYKHNLLNFKFVNLGFKAVTAYNALTGADQSTLSNRKLLTTTCGLVGLLGTPLCSRKLIAFALAFKQRKRVRRWLDLAVGHPDNLRRLLSHRLSVNPYAVNLLLTRFLRRARRTQSREFWYFFPKIIQKQSKAQKPLRLFLNLHETTLRRVWRRRYFFKTRCKHPFWWYRRQAQQRFQRNRGWEGQRQNKNRQGFFHKTVRRQSHAEWWYRRKGRINNVKGKCIRLVFEKDFMKGFARILAWRFRKLRYYALLARLAGCWLNSNKRLSGVIARLLSTKGQLATKIFHRSSFSSLYLKERLSFLIPKDIIATSGKLGGFSNFLFFVDGFLRRTYFKLRISKQQRSRRSEDKKHLKLQVGAFINRQTRLLTTVRRFGERQLQLVKQKRQVVLLPKTFRNVVRHNPVRFSPKTLLHQLACIVPWYERRPFSRSKFFRFYRLHPRFASVFFPNFLPRFVEPSLKAFEFLIRPVMLKSFDLRLPFKVRRGVRLNLLMSLV